MTVEISGPGSATLLIRTDPYGLHFEVYQDSPLSRDPEPTRIAHVRMRPLEGVAYLKDMLRGTPSIFGYLGWEIEYEVTERAPAFVLRTVRSQRAFRRFEMRWGDPHTYAKALLAELEPTAADPKPSPQPAASPPSPQPSAPSSGARLVGQPSYTPAPGRLP